MERTATMTHNEATGGARSFRFGVVAPIRTDLPAWRDQVRRIADSGFSTLLMPDVQQWQPAPGPTLAVAATLADLRVGTWVYASGSPRRPSCMSLDVERAFYRWNISSKETNNRGDNSHEGDRGNGPGCGKGRAGA